MPERRVTHGSSLKRLHGWDDQILAVGAKDDNWFPYSWSLGETLIWKIFLITSAGDSCHVPLVLLCNFLIPTLSKSLWFTILIWFNPVTLSEPVKLRLLSSKPSHHLTIFSSVCKSIPPLTNSRLLFQMFLKTNPISGSSYTASTPAPPPPPVGPGAPPSSLLFSEYTQTVLQHKERIYFSLKLHFAFHETSVWTYIRCSISIVGSRNEWRSL